MMASLTSNPSMRVMGCPFAMIPMTGGTFDHSSSVRRTGNPFMTTYAGGPSMNRLAIFFLINIERDWFSIDLLFNILFPMAILAEKNRCGHAFIAVQVGLAVALPAEFFLSLHPLFVCQPSGNGERREECSDEKNEKEHKEVFSHPSFLFLLQMLV
jgi:hypothetical protein